jgi:hypothetical protein
MPKFANAHLVLNSRDRNLAGSRGVYNNFVLANPGQNIVQGQMKDVALSEVLFPYDLPNIMPGYNVFELYTVAPAPPLLWTITVPVGFYTAAELVAEINDLIDALALADGLAAGEYPVLAYSATNNIFSFGGVTSPTYDTYWVLASPYTFSANYVGVATPELGKDILRIMGYSKTQTGQVGTAGSVSGSAPLLFTQYVDICSPTLCQYQFLRDGSTTSLPRRVDLICRLYIEDETSMPTAFDAQGNAIPTGTRPFVIHRQFKNQRVMRSTAANAINDVDIQLYDDCGQPLITAWNPRDFQITFHVYEAGDRESEGNIGYRY